MIYQGVEFELNPELPDNQSYRKNSSPVVEVNRRLYGFLQAMALFETSLMPMLEKLGGQFPEVQDLAAESATYAAEVRQVIEELKRLPPHGYGVATIGDWTAP
jgi:hypothetical protein